jgi:hypothetical protein
VAGPVGVKRRGLGDIARLLAVLGDAAQDDLTDQPWVDAGALAQVFVELFQQFVGRQFVEPAAVLGLGARAADGLLDIGCPHAPTPTTKLAQVVVLPPTLKVIMFSGPGSW